MKKLLVTLWIGVLLVALVFGEYEITILILLAILIRYEIGENSRLRACVQMWRRRCEDRAARIASLEQTVAWLKSELGATEDAAEEVER